MRRSAVPAVLGVLLGACGGGDGVQWAALEVRASEAPVSGNLVWCSGGMRAAICDPAYALFANPYQGVVQLATMTVFLSAVEFRFEVERDAVVGIQGRYATACDSDGCELEVMVPTAGWIAPDLVDAALSGRQTGTFHMQFGDAGIDGTYDTAASE